MFADSVVASDDKRESNNHAGNFLQRQSNGKFTIYQQLSLPAWGG